ncbi:MAG: taurine dioxygenase [Alphaproteobacteria bacterium]|jgi:taurine dioxygenase|nr:taurine dioxygenase [Alphaproteobacteria bacterium]PPR14429.1 MAG: Alpha-ketoglutarate-dependent taurine dioxygenase [Alphaproteobacteria bacterium MarineAlpha12_Bin1]|tara:strand:+ start:8520 stop:9386 length:867 start_codon:yes stop_codon:yes gene_type:complete
MKIVPMTSSIGAEIIGANLEKLSETEFEKIHDAFTKHLVLFFRDQDELSPETQISFAKRFGDLHYHPAAPKSKKYPELFVIHSHKDSKFADGNGWHTDVSCDSEPPLGSCLQLHVLPSTGGDTLFASMYAAFETLSSTMQKFLSTLTAIHESEHLYRGRYEERGVDDTDTIYPTAEHPLIRTHPVSGRQSIYVNPSFTTKIKDLSRSESKSLLSFIYNHQQRPEFQVRFRWSKNAIAFWDNRCTQHFALWDYWPDERKGNRVTIKGEKPFYKPSQLVESKLKISDRNN